MLPYCQQRGAEELGLLERYLLLKARKNPGNLFKIRVIIGKNGFRDRLSKIKKEGSKIMKMVTEKEMFLRNVGAFCLVGLLLFGSGLAFAEDPEVAPVDISRHFNNDGVAFITNPAEGDLGGGGFNSPMSLRKVINVKDFGAVADGKHDDTAAIQKALDAAVAKGIPICFLPAGLYRLDGSLIVPAGVTLAGASGGVPHSLAPIGTVLLAYGGRGNPHGPPLITLKSNAVIRNLIIHYPEQRFPDIVPYPWTIRGDGQLIQVIDITMTNPYKAMDFGTKWNELHIIRNVFAQPLRIGLYINQVTDIGRVENVHFNPNFWTRMALEPRFRPEDVHDLFAHLRENLTGFKIGRTDWQYISNSFVIFARAGFHFFEGRSGLPGRQGPGNVLLTQSGADLGIIGVQVDALQPHAGVAFVNSQFMNEVSVKIGPENRGPVKFSNCGFWGVEETTSHIINAGLGPVIVTGCHFIRWDRRDEGIPAIHVKRGSIVVSDSVFMDSALGIVIEPDVDLATITGNIFNVSNPIVNRSAGNVQIGLNAFPPPPKKEAGAIIIDDRDPGFKRQGVWRRASGRQFYRGLCLWAVKGSPNTVASWQAILPKPGKYEVFIWHGGDPHGDRATKARYEIVTRHEVVEKWVDQTVDIVRWRSLGTFEFATHAEVRLFAEDANGNVLADAVKWVPREACETRKN